jgi:hypothetical protein
VSWFPRALGAVTAVYGATVIVRPELLTKPSDLAATSDMKSAVRAVAARDLASGLAMTFAPVGRSLRVALAIRIASDLSDAIIFGAKLPTQVARRKAAAAALLWAGLNLVALKRAS